jgi:serine/threonine-protein kinase
MALLEEVIDSGRPPEEVCRGDPELLPAVLAALSRVRSLEAEVAAVFPVKRPAPRDGPSDLASSESPLPVLPGYSVLGVLGYGGMGVVYKAHHLKLNRVVAVKMLLAGGFASPTELTRFTREAQAIAGLRHPNIVQVHDIGELDGHPYFTMEYLEGGSLAQKLGGAPQPARLAASMVALLADAVQVAHDGGIIHRDLKPANILLTADGVPKVSDFGLARNIGDGEDLTLGGTRLGTPSYMSPEQAIARQGTIGPSADIYSLGAVLYEMLTGRPPFRGDSAAETERQLLSDDPAPPRLLNGRIPRDLEVICLTCLHKTPASRYASAQALAD